MTQTATNRSGKLSTDGALIASDKVEGTKVLDQSGKDIGSIKRLKIDKASGRVAYAVVEFGGFLGMGSHEYTIPWATLNYDAEKHAYRTGITKDQLEGAPVSSRRPATAYRASAGGVGTGNRPASESVAAADARPDSDVDAYDDAPWDRNRDRELYDYYAVGYYWEE